MDSSCGTAGVASRTNSPTNMRPLGDFGYLPSSSIKARYGYYASYDNIEDGIVNAVALYGKLYAGKSSDQITRTWAQTSNPSYYAAIQACYE